MKTQRSFGRTFVLALLAMLSGAVIASASTAYSEPGRITPADLATEYLPPTREHLNQGSL